MFRNFFKTAIRNISKNKFFTILNVIGLALGMSLSLLYIALLCFLYRFDNFHPDGERIYRVTSQVHDKKENPRYASAPAGLAQRLNNFSGIERVVRINGSLHGEAAYGEKKMAINGYFADPEFFALFNYPLVKGNKTTAITNPNSIVLSEREAKKIFGSREPMGKIIEMEGYGSFLVTGVFKDLPQNTHLSFEAIASYSSLNTKGVHTGSDGDGWNSFRNSYVYFLLGKKASKANLEQYLNGLAEDQYAKVQSKVSFTLQGLNSIVPGPQLYDQIGQNWSYLDLLLIGLMTLIVLIPACSNYINLSISQSLERMREIGVRKVMGGNKKQIILQFIIESTSIVLIALIFSFLFSEVIRKELLYQMVETSPVDLAPRWETLVGFLLFALLVGVITGFAPAVYFTKMSAINALKGKELKGSGRSVFRKIVLTTQFIISLGFIMAVVIMMRQYKYSVNYDLGFEQKGILDAKLLGVDGQRFKNEFAKLPEVEQISMSSHILGTGSTSNRFVKTAYGADSIAASSMSVDQHFISNMKLDILAGQNFSSKPSDNARLILANEALISRLGIKEPATALQHFVILDSTTYQIAGVLKNFHHAGLKEKIQPFFFEYNPGKFLYANIKLASGDAVGSLGKMEAIWKRIGGSGKFTAQLFSEEIKEAYAFYKIIIRFWSFLGLLAITVACLGLLGTVSFTGKKRVKEISIRKIMGASAENLVLLLSKDFIKLMMVAAIITIPAVYLLFNQLLAQLQFYSISIGPIDMMTSLLIMLIFCLTTVLSQTLKAANANPANNLRTE